MFRKKIITMGNKCLEPSKINGYNNNNKINRIFEKSGSQNTEETRVCKNKEFPITKLEMALLEESWKTISPKWDQICSIAFARLIFI